MQEIISFACAYMSCGSVSFFFSRIVFVVCFVYFYGNLCYVPCGGVLLCVKDSNMITLYASGTVLLIYIGGRPYRSKGTYCVPNLACVHFSLVLWFKNHVDCHEMYGHFKHIHTLIFCI